MKSKIGILALGRAENYGAVLQSYSLCKYIRENFNNLCEVIDFTPRFMIGRYPLYYIDKSSYIKFIRSLIKNMMCFPGRIKKRKRFDVFRTKYACFTENKYIEHLRDEFDEYVVGSDQVFNLKLTNYDFEFFLPKIRKDKNTITYAASLGNRVFSDEEIELYKKYMPRFNGISIRETDGANFIQSIINDKDIYQHLDPVFLTSKEEWESMLIANMHTKPYILIYTFKDFELAYELAKRMDDKLDVLFINEGFKRLKQDVKNVRGSGPLEFLTLIHNAECIITDSFHGTAFSIIFEKKFISIPYNGTESRFYSMFNALGMVGNENIDQSEYFIFDNVNYHKVREKIEVARRSSFQYLNRYL